MTSAKKIAANRSNAKRNRGPRTEASKRRISRNALRHGLAAVKYVDYALPRDVELMAQALCGNDASPILFEQALAIAESEMVLRHVREQRVTLIERLRDLTAIPLVKGDNGIEQGKARLREFETSWEKLEQVKARFFALPKAEWEKLMLDYEDQELVFGSKSPPIEERDEFEAMQEAIPDLNRLARYERRAWSRRKRALRHFIDIKSSRKGDLAQGDRGRAAAG
jgi:hypothetical protein